MDANLEEVPTKAGAVQEKESARRSRMLSSGDPLLDFWYPAMRGVELRRGRMERRVLLSKPLLLCRASDGEVFALDDHCPHRGMPLSYGHFDGSQVECIYHGWQFDREGRCSHIPAILPDSPVKPERIRARKYECAEADDLIWVLMPGPLVEKGAVPEVPRLPTFSPKFRSGYIQRILKCNIDHGIVGLMDPAHGPFVHQSFWWRSRGSIHEKSKSFEPIPLGFRMSAHKPSGNSAAYKLLNLYGEPITTTIDFVLPSVRFEQVRCGPHWFSSRTTVTPITADECRLEFYAAWNVFRWAPFLGTLFHLFASSFVGQDQRIMEMQAQGLKDNPSLMLIDDADTQAQWYYRLKTAFIAYQQGARAFEHPIKGPVTLRWRS